VIDKEISNIFNTKPSESAKIKKILRNLENNNKIYLTGLTGSARNFIVSFIINKINRPVLVATPDISSALNYNKDLTLFTDKKVSFLPSQEVSPYEQVWSDPNIREEQLKTLESFKSGEIQVLLTPAKNLLNSFLAQDKINKSSIYLKIKEKADPHETANLLTELGYKRVTTVVDPGEFSLRGDILDVYPISNEPVRIEFFCEEVEYIRIFNIDTQRSVRRIEEITIEPRYNILISEEEKQIFIDKINEIKQKQLPKLSELAQYTLETTIDDFISSFEADIYTEGIEYLSPLLNEKTGDIFDYIPKNTVIIVHESTELEHKLFVQDEKYIKEYEKNINEGLALELPYMLHKNPEEIIKKLYKFPALNLNSFIGDETELEEELEVQAVPKFLADINKAAYYMTDLKNQGYSVLLVTEYPQRVEEALKEFEDYSTDVMISKIGFSEGFVLPELKLAVVTDTELFNRKVKKPTLGKKLSKKENIDYLTSLNDLKEGDYIVHEKHGIGKFIGLCKQEIDGQEKDYLTIEYAQSDRLYMPAEQINLLSRYRGAGTLPKLTRMGGADWTKVKNKVKAAIADIADQLLQIYARRAKAKGFSFESDSPWQLEIENAFPYTETPDQLQAINDTKSDMESEKVMDRLICGDVGFGKTEVALRAVTKAILSGKQVAVLAPTTILANQHYLTFSQRLKPYPIKVDLLSRFRTPKLQKQTLKDLLTGDCDLVIGTHRLLQKDIQFKKLGLLVVDEEHRFGVTHKEKIKEFKADVDVLTLSATPIPRTLNMALSGLREMSIINTPPVNRAPVKTYVGHYNESLLRTALNHELEREGQVYFLHNRVQTIYKVAEELQQLVPNARIAVAHGQMNEKDLERIMAEFGEHEYDILVCTTIIESGLDIPNANTIIIDDADRFGLAQLYQIRGRVGRSETQAYAYCFYRDGKVLNKEAKDRLKAIKDFTTLGSGYQIALRDLEIRGVGNILGPQQHGQMVSVGFDLYCQLLEETIKELKGEKVEKKDPTIIDINITAFIPDEWVTDKELKMLEYKRLADVKSFRELQAIEDEWQDRFGKLPEEVKKLIKVIKLRLMATDIGILLVREAFESIRMFSNISLPEFRLLQNKMRPELSRKLKWTPAPKTSETGSSIILISNQGLSNEDKLDILEEIFSAIINFRF
jgi:transcription-repair coupling factor (superfamily II helicase)